MVLHSHELPGYCLDTSFVSHSPVCLPLPLPVRPPPLDQSTIDISSIPLTLNYTNTSFIKIDHLTINRTNTVRRSSLFTPKGSLPTYNPSFASSSASKDSPWRDALTIPPRPGLLFLLWDLCGIKHKTRFWALCRPFCSVQANDSNDRRDGRHLPSSKRLMYLYCYARVDVLVPSYRQISIFPKQLEGIDFPHTDTRCLIRMLEHVQYFQSSWTRSIFNLRTQNG